MTAKELLKDSALNFLGGIVQAKQNGEKLPKALDTIAGLAISGQGAALTLAENEIKKQSMEKMSWLIVGILTIVIIGLLANK